jgi:hypothetical protein
VQQATWKDNKNLKRISSWQLKRNPRNKKQEYQRTDHTGEVTFELDDDLMHALEQNFSSAPVIPNLTHQRAVAFLKNKLTAFDCRRLEYFRVTSLPKREWSYNITNPQRIAKGRRYWKHYYQIRMGLNPRLMYPHKEKIAIGSYKTGSDWGYEEQLVEFRSLDELFVFVAGAVTYRFVKHDKQIEEGRLGNPSANLYGLKWFEEFTGRDPMVVRGRHFHSIDDEFWVQKG